MKQWKLVVGLAVIVLPIAASVLATTTESKDVIDTIIQEWKRDKYYVFDFTMMSKTACVKILEAHVTGTRYTSATKKKAVRVSEDISVFNLDA